MFSIFLDLKCVSKLKNAQETIAKLCAIADCKQNNVRMLCPDHCTKGRKQKIHFKFHFLSKN